MPIIIYNVPGRISSNVTAETNKLANENKNIIGIGSIGDFDQIMKTIKNKPNEFLVISVMMD